jgi:hypothetical protein
MSGRLLRQLHGFEGFGAVEVRSDADDLALADREDPARPNVELGAASLPAAVDVQAAEHVVGTGGHEVLHVKHEVLELRNELREVAQDLGATAVGAGSGNRESSSNSTPGASLSTEAVLASSSAASCDIDPMARRTISTFSCDIARPVSRLTEAAQGPLAGGFLPPVATKLTQSPWFLKMP